MDILLQKGEFNRDNWIKNTKVYNLLYALIMLIIGKYLEGDCAVKKDERKDFSEKIESALNNYDIELKHHVPGRVRLRILQWENRKQILQKLLEERLMSIPC